MSGKGYHILFFVALVSLNVNQGVFGDEPSEDAQPHYEYTQIFKSIPALFEYLFDALEERPEILEKNDVTMFERNINGLDTDECEISDNNGNTEKRHAICNKHLIQDFNNIDKRDAKDVTKTTVAYEYGNSNAVMEAVHDEEGNKVISKRLAKIYDVKRNKKEKPNINSGKKTNDVSKVNDDFNRNFKDHSEVFLGYENLFGLDLKPEDIEERILTAEKLLEEHNNKKDK